MERQNVRAAYLQKERELVELENEYTRQKRDIENQSQELCDRNDYFTRIVDAETDQMYAIMRRFNVSYDDVRSCFLDVEHLVEQSDRTYHQQMNLLQHKEEMLEKNFRRQRENLEEEYYRLRREYASTDE